METTTMTPLQIAMQSQAISENYEFSFRLRDKFDVKKQVFSSEGNVWGGNLSIECELTSPIGERSELGLMKTNLLASNYTRLFKNFDDLLQNGRLSYDKAVCVIAGEPLPFKKTENAKVDFVWLPNCRISRK